MVVPEDYLGYAAIDVDGCVEASSGVAVVRELGRGSTGLPDCPGLG